MGRQPEQDNEDWDLPNEEDLSEEDLKELSPLQETQQRSLFQRIARQRAVYFADVEDDPDSGEDDDDIDGTHGAEKRTNDEDGTDGTHGNEKCTNDKDGGQREILLPPSGFADLSTWCCDALLPGRPRPAPPKRQFIRMPSIVDQPTMILSLLAPSLMHIADLPTQPELIAVSAPIMGSSLSSHNIFLFVGSSKLWEMLARFCRRFLHEQRARRIHKKQPSVSKGRELLMERLRERQQSGVFAVLPTPPGERYPRQTRLPADRLFS